MLFQCKSQIILVENRERQEIRRNTLSIRRNTQAKTPQAKTFAPTEKKKSRAQLAPTKEGR